MRADIYPLQMLLLTVSGWVQRHQADVIAYLVEENRVCLPKTSHVLGNAVLTRRNRPHTTA